MPESSSFPSPVHQPRDLRDYAVRGSFPVGEITVHHVTDGLTFGVRRFWFNGIDPTIWMPELSLIDPDTPFPVNYGLFVVVGAGAVTLVDAGFGPAVLTQPVVRAGNELITRLREIGIAPGDVDHIILTHMHSDHCGQLVAEDVAGGPGRVTFPRATVHVHQRELDHWTGTASDGDPMSPYVRSRIRPVMDAGLVETFTERTAVASGVTALPMVGHTAGHTCVLVESAGEHCLLVGDLAHHPIHFRHHGWLPEIDADPPSSIVARRKLTDLAIELGALVTGPHMPVLTLGRLGRDDGGVTWTPVDVAEIGGSITME